MAAMNLGAGTLSATLLHEAITSDKQYIQHLDPVVFVPLNDVKDLFDQKCKSAAKMTPDSKFFVLTENQFNKTLRPHIKNTKQGVWLKQSDSKVGSGVLDTQIRYVRMCFQGPGPDARRNLAPGVDQQK